ncbi:MAG TPA: flagellar biosynthesis protein FlhA [Polyangiales bacterium]|nr:flagellar biosynthesis protein FlhA [Polyangiales bacterium]
MAKPGENTPMSPTRGRLADAVLAGLVMLIIAMMVVPLPTWLLDQLIALNLALSLLLLVTAMYVPHGLAFTSMPSVLLITTLYRLALNVSSTRLILLQADAGQVIRAFGTFMVRGDYVVGAVIFLIVSLIQYIVVAKGGERVAEVAARFTLDAMPGKQLAIDADLRAGGLRVEAAQARRAQLERESRFYGAMDGAMKFIKGDAIAGLVIVGIAFVGGTSIGYFNRSLPLDAALKLYGLLAIGDGLVSQLPALVTSTAAGLTVTRVAGQDTSSLGQDVIGQLFDRPRSLFAVAASLGMLACVPGLPALPFTLLGVLCAARGASLFRARSRGPQIQVGAAPATVQLDLGPQLAAASGQQRLLEQLRHSQPPAASSAQSVEQLLHAQLKAAAERLGLPAPSQRIAFDATLPDQSFVLRLRRATLLRGKARDTTELMQLLELELPGQLASRARELLSLEDLQQQLDRVAGWAPSLVQSVVPRVFTLTQLAEILRRLLDENISIAALERILESLAGLNPKTASLDRGLEQARRALCDQLVESHVQAETLHVHVLDPMIEDALRESGQLIDGERVLALPPDLAQDIVKAVRQARAHHAQAPVLVTQSDVRRSLHEVLRQDVPDATVISYNELPINITVDRRAPITVGRSP